MAFAVASIVALPLSVSCSSAANFGGDEVRTREPVDDDERETHRVAQTSLIELPTPDDDGVDPPDWLAEGIDPVPYFDGYSGGAGRELVGTEIALIPLGAVHLIAKRGEGIVGTLNPNGPVRWAGVLEDDRIIASVNNDIVRAESAEAAMAGEWTSIASGHDLVAWDVAGPYFMYASTDPAIHVSDDGGTSFTTHNPTQGLSIENSEIRPDGAIAVLSRDASYRATGYLSPDAGKTWLRSPFDPESLDRIGSWMYSTNGSCTWVVSDDGRHWVKAEKQLNAQREPSWAPLSTVRFSPTWRTGDASLAHADVPRPPEFDPAREAKGLQGPCTGGVGIGHNVPGPTTYETPEGWVARRGSVDLCAELGLTCLRQPVAPAPLWGERVFMFLSDGVCPPGPNGSCASPRVRPSVIHIHPDTVQASVKALPESCVVPVHMFNLRGLGLAICHDPDADTVSLHVGAAESAFTEELTIPGEMRRFTAGQAADGTVLLASMCENGLDVCGAWMRAPEPPGSDSAWRDAELGHHVVGVRLLGGGRLLVLRAPPAEDDGDRSMPLMLELVESGDVFWGDRFPILEDWRPTQPIHGFELDAQGHLIVVTERDGVPHRFAVTEDGELRALVEGRIPSRHR